MEKRIFVWIDTDENRRFTICPQCNNKEFAPEAKYCEICGFYLFNICEGEETPCYHINSGRARFCEVCGQKTRLYSLGYLTSPEKYIEFSNIDDDDLPF